MWSVLRRNPVALLLAILLHVGLVVFLVFEIDWRDEVEPIGGDVKVVQARLIDVARIEADERQQAQAEEQRRQAELVRQQASERKRQAEAEQRRKADEERQRQAEAEQQRKAEEERKRQAEAEQRLREQEEKLEAARRARYDIDVLRARFRVSWEQAAMRMTTLGHDPSAAIPFFAAEIDHAGHPIRRVGAQGFPQARFGGRCPKLPIHSTFAEPGRVLVEAVEMPDGAEFLAIARTLEGPQAAFNERPRRTALMLGCDIAFAGETVYGRATTRADHKSTPIGPSCRLCERQGCMARAEPPLTRPLGLDEMVTGFFAFDYT